MVSRFRSWWQQSRKLLIVLGLLVALVAVIALVITVVLSNGTGFDGYIKVTTAHIISGPSKGTVTRTEEYQQGKALWDWLQLLIIPIMLVIGGYWLNRIQKDREQRATEERVEREKREAEQRAKTELEAAEKHAETEREIALDNQREKSLQEYIDKMSELFLHEDLLGSDPKKEVRGIARIRTLTVLNRLDGKRKGSVLQFLKDSELINLDTTIIYLHGANLSGAYLCEAFLNGTRLYNVDLSRANLRQAHLGYVPYIEPEDQEYTEGADLSEANLSRADLERVKLRHANLTKANLSGADLDGADLSYANLTEADLSYAKLIDADLKYADLTGADLTNTELCLTAYGGDNSSGANLSYAKLKGVIGISIEELEKRAGSLKGATMPDGSRYH